MPDRPFTLFGVDHCVGLGLTVVAAVALAWLVRRHRGRPLARRVRVGLAVGLLAVEAFYVAWAATTGEIEAWRLVPLHLCDLALFLAAFVLLTGRQLGYECLYFWGCTGTFLALVTPDMPRGFPDWHFLAYFGLHGGVVVAAVVLTVGSGMRPAPGAHWRVFGITNAYAAVIAVVNLVFGTNFLFLCAKPESATLLDVLGPWPVYIGVVEVLGIVLFWLLYWPWRRAAWRPRGLRACLGRGSVARPSEPRAGKDAQGASPGGDP